MKFARRQPGKMNRYEEMYLEQILHPLLSSGEVSKILYEGITLKLADRLRYTPDFTVILSNGTVEFHEVKGFWKDDAKAKIKMAAAIFPARFVAAVPKIRKAGTTWTYTEF